MIRFEDTEVYNFDGAIRGMRNPLESWDRTDSYYDDALDYEVIGRNDMKLMHQLVRAGTDHSKFTREIMVSVDITAPEYWFKEFDTYKVGTVANSTSTMHKVMSREFTSDMFSFEHTSPERANLILDNLNGLRDTYLATKDRNVWYELIQTLPMSYNYTRTCTLNYAVVWNMYQARCLNPHKLDEWSKGFRDWADSLPYFTEIFLGKKH